MSTLALPLVLAAWCLGVWCPPRDASAQEPAPAPSAAPVPSTTGPSAAPGQGAEIEPLPLPPVPPRIANGEDYERCLSLLTSDPVEADKFADAWFATGGGEGAEHCLALARIALGQADVGAAMLEKLASHSRAPDVARATVYGQATQAWLIAGDASHAYGSATLALALLPDDPDLLVDRSVAAGTLGRYQDAVDDLTHALDLDPKRADLFVYRGSAWRHLSQAGLAQDDIDRALALDPENAEALLERGILRERRNDRDGARDDWERAIVLAPGTATADLAQQDLALLDAGPDQR